VFNDFELEKDNKCISDYVSVYDGNDTNAPLLGTYCGNTAPSPIFSSSNQIYMVFNSDSEVQGKGFSATYTELYNVLVARRDGERRIYSHAEYGSQLYENNIERVWIITVPAGLVRLRFSAFNIEAHNLCAYDFVKVFDGSNDSAPLLKTFCGDQERRGMKKLLAADGFIVNEAAVCDQNNQERGSSSTGCCTTSKMKRCVWPCTLREGDRGHQRQVARPRLHEHGVDDTLGAPQAGSRRHGEDIPHQLRLVVIETPHADRAESKDVETEVTTAPVSKRARELSEEASQNSGAAAPDKPPPKAPLTRRSSLRPKPNIPPGRSRR
ncbi:hypothetical protein HPB47_016826, partial [Ixodes persulcatus]